MSFHVGRDGLVKNVFVEKSDLGAWTVESCVLGIARSMHFVKPSGGEAYFKLPVTFPAQRQVNVLATPLDGTEITAQREGFDACLGAPASAKITMYIAKGGRVKNVGFSSLKQISTDWSDCAASAIREWTLTVPNNDMVKTTLRVPLE